MTEFCKLPYRLTGECSHSSDLSEDDKIKVVCEIKDNKKCPACSILVCHKKMQDDLK
jgi:hypothetical protein